MERIDEYASDLRKTIKTRVVKAGVFKKLPHAFSGQDLFECVKTNFGIGDPEAQMMCHKLLKEEIIYPVTGQSSTFSQDSEHFYRFHVDREGIAANMYRIYKGQARPAIQVSIDLVLKMNEVLKEVIYSPGPGEKKLNIEKLKESKKYEEYQKAACELQAVQLIGLYKDEIVSFFLNLYQVMYVHKKLDENLFKQEKSILRKLKNLIM